MDVNGTPIPKFIAQLRDDAARIRGNIEARPDADKNDLGWFQDAAYTQAIFDMAADTIEKMDAECFKLAAGVCQHKLGNEHGNAYCGKTNELI